MTNPFERFGVNTIVNAYGPLTRLGGSLLPPKVASAMQEASRYCVDMTALQSAASVTIAKHTGAEAGYVTSGAAAGLLLGTAACVTGLDVGKMNRLPDTRGMKNEVVVAKSQRNFYDHAVRTAGVVLVEVGIPDRYSGAGVRDAEPWEFSEAISENTAAVYYVAAPQSQPDLEDVIKVAHAKGVPVLVDAAGRVPPAANLRTYIDKGADLVVFSGGKGIRGPQASGILCGRRDLVMAAALQHLDHDIHFEQFSPPGNLIDKTKIPGLPHHGIGRPCKVGKEEIVGLLTALELFIEEDPDLHYKNHLGVAQDIEKHLQNIRNVTVQLKAGGGMHPLPSIELQLDEAAAGITTRQLVTELQNGAPSIHADPTHVGDRKISFRTACLKDGEPELIGQKIRKILG